MPTDEEKAATIATNLENFNKVKDTPIFAQHQNTHAKAYHEQQKVDVIKKAQGEAWGHIDNLMIDILGIERVDNPQTSKTLEPFLKELVETRKKLKQGGATDAEAIEALKKQHGLDMQGVRDLLGERDGEISTLKANATKKAITEALAKGLRGKKFKAHYTDDDVEELTALKLNKRANLAKIEDGKVIFYGADGQKLINPKTSLNMTAKEVIEMDFEGKFEEKTAGGGANSGNLDGDNKNDVNKAAWFENDKVVMNKKLIKSRDDFYKAFSAMAVKNAIAVGTGKFDKLYKEAMSEYDYNALPSS
jgi:hypothetical protein